MRETTRSKALKGGTTHMMQIPLFPLGVVLLPGSPMPLHIFEERYKEMIAACLEGDLPFGIVYYDGKDLRGAGCLARITRVLKRYEDGRMDIIVRGERRFLLRELIEEKAYAEARIVLFDDDPSPRGVDIGAEARQAETLLLELAEADDVASVLTDAVRSDPEALSFAVASTAAFEPAEKQRFLEMTSSLERLKKAVQALAAVAERSRVGEQVQRIIGGNGHLPRHLAERFREV
jgi:Lon protease-like protein